MENTMSNDCVMGNEIMVESAELLNESGNVQETEQVINNETSELAGSLGGEADMPAKTTKSPTTEAVRNQSDENDSSVKRLQEGVSCNPMNISTTFFTLNRMPMAKLKLIYNERMSEEISVQVNTGLLKCIMDTLRGNIASLVAYKKEDFIEEEDEDEGECKMGMFKALLENGYRANIKKDFINKKGERFFHIRFPISYGREIYFFIKRDEVTEKLVADACKPKTEPSII